MKKAIREAINHSINGKELQDFKSDGRKWYYRRFVFNDTAIAVVVPIRSVTPNITGCLSRPLCVYLDTDKLPYLFAGMFVKDMHINCSFQNVIDEARRKRLMKYKYQHGEKLVTIHKHMRKHDLKAATILINYYN